MNKDSNKTKRVWAILALAVVVFCILGLPTSRIYLCGASTMHLKSGEWVMAGPSFRMTDGRLKFLVAAINDRRDISCMRLSNPNVSDEGYSAVSDLVSLKWLFVCDSQLTDEALVHFGKLKNLKRLDFDGCPNLTEASIERLQASIPDCTIYVD